MQSFSFTSLASSPLHVSVLQLLLASSHSSTYRVLLSYLRIIGFQWQRNSSAPLGNGAKSHTRLCSSNEIDFCIIICVCVYVCVR